ncbi:IS110 family transposase ISMno26 [Methylobacterium frigidaeris]|uniref:IS110 family transposase ISMno26 n=1 Tax=Methylobacterium frigidaeris TaxID=2038277 RepID=A0AA37M8N4_9HYPH|nr:IS110 family transposase ISMno26 [Methylobacterium frigidaeris]
MPPAYVKPYVKRVKTDAAIAEAVSGPTMRFVAVKTVHRQAVLMLHKVRDLMVRQRTVLINALRGHLAELGMVAAQGPAGVKAIIAEFWADQISLPALARSAVCRLIGQIDDVAEEIK